VVTIVTCCPREATKRESWTSEIWWGRAMADWSCGGLKGKEEEALFF